MKSRNLWLGLLWLIYIIPYSLLAESNEELIQQMMKHYESMDLEKPKVKSKPKVVKEKPKVVKDNSQALLDKADDQAAAGQMDSAAATLERALRIEPENARLWNVLAGIRFKQGRLDEAILMAEKSNSLASNQTSLQARNWRLIVVARSRLGQTEAVIEALRRARLLEQSDIQ